ncbi:MAG: hypothetical protein EA412_06650 [Chitinophagaceae bacterium]|nr:MAG: hypothetical protein EA412_06650 [Chitinophagaceae bacterium]
MKKASTDLFDLIKSMNMQEKRYFKLFASKQSGTKNYILIYDAIAKQNTYDEQAIKKQFSSHRFIIQFARAKNYLYSLIINSLVAFHSDDNIENSLLNNMQQISILVDKGLLKQAHKLLLVSKRIAEEYEHFEILLKLIEKERSLVFRLYYKNDSILKLQSISSEIEDVLIKIKLSNEYREIWQLNTAYSQNLGGIRSNIDRENFLKKIINPEKRISPKDNDFVNSSVRIKVYYHQSCGVYYEILNDYNKSLVHRIESVKILEENKKVIEDNARAYFICLQNSIMILMALYHFEEALRYIEKAKNAFREYQGISSEEYRSIYVYETDYYVQTGKFEIGYEMIKVINNDIESVEISQRDKAFIYFNFSIICLGVENYDEGLYFLNKVLNETMNYLDSETYSVALLLNIIFHYELKNNRLIDYLVSNTYRQLLKRKSLHNVEKAFLNFIRKKLPKVTNNIELKHSFEVLKTELEKMTKNQNDKRILQQFDFISWLESKVTDNSFSDILDRKKI